ncbi:flagellar biosynthetic protein FliO [Microbacterium hydrocarbonoxydans]|uniref:flagellar biosynthetic protein FliO n=1 Tax=Microbacterium hydrocarbonoxydans TaxID=273678 RepID=UPI00203F16ED|nr:flagellar biosynthetic protein FliO [Microbacterium hydrocarbonoxydans]MCM3780502.1 flagellar biosynthetic protein FliO [Microbacterium hydrocarbonoxydans]
MDDLLVAVRAIVALAAVLGLLVFLSKRLQKSQSTGTGPLAGLVPKKLARTRAPRPAPVRRTRQERITVVARSGLGGRAQLVVAEFGGIRYVLGVTEQGVSVVDTQEAPVAEDESITAVDEAASTPPDDIVDRALRSVA